MSGFQRLLIGAVVAAVVLVGATPAFAATGPSLRIVPTPATAGQTLTAYGAGFCGAPACPRVQVIIGGRVVATADVDSTGAFAARFAAPSISDQYAVVAEQTGKPGRRATSGLLIVPSDLPPQSTPTTVFVEPTNAPKSSTTLPGAARTTTSSRSTTSAPFRAVPVRPAAGHDGAGPLPWVIAAVGFTAVLAGSIYAVRRRARR